MVFSRCFLVLLLGEGLVHAFVSSTTTRTAALFLVPAHRFSILNREEQRYRVGTSPAENHRPEEPTSRGAPLPVCSFGTTRLFATTRSSPVRAAAARSSSSSGRGRRRPSDRDTVERRRRVLLSRSGPHFQLDRSSGKIEFGATAPLVTELENRPAAESIATWLLDGRGIAKSIWDEKLMTDLGGSMYRLQIMTLQFVTIKLSPWVDVEMKSTVGEVGGDDEPVFTLQSYGFDPNIQVLPAMRITAESLGIIIEVSGELRPTKNGTGVRGIISFQTSGKLPLPMRVLPEAVLRVASDTINRTVAGFAIRSFERGARKKYQEFRRQRQSQDQEQLDVAAEATK